MFCQEFPADGATSASTQFCVFSGFLSWLTCCVFLPTARQQKSGKGGEVWLECKDGWEGILRNSCAPSCGLLNDESLLSRAHCSPFLQVCYIILCIQKEQRWWSGTWFLICSVDTFPPEQTEKGIKAPKISLSFKRHREENVECSRKKDRKHGNKFQNKPQYSQETLANVCSSSCYYWRIRLENWKE